MVIFGGAFPIYSLHASACRQVKKVGWRKSRRMRQSWSGRGKRVKLVVGRARVPEPEPAQKASLPESRCRENRWRPGL
jgi:hypothetical protein